MAISISKPTSQAGTTSNLAVYSLSPSFLPNSNALIVVFCNASASQMGSLSNAGGFTPTLQGSINPQAAGHSFRYWDGYASPTAPSTISINLDYTGDNATGCTGAALQATGVSSGAAPVQTKLVSSIGANPAVTFNQAVLQSNAVMVAIAFNGALAAPITVPSAAWTTITASFATPTTGLMVA